MTAFWLLTADDVRELHQRGLKEFGGGDGERETGCVAGRVGSALSALAYSERDDDPLYFAAALLTYFAKAQCFVDGNKRVALAACVEVLHRCELSIETKSGEAAEFVLRVVNESLPVEEVARWLGSKILAL